MQGAVPIYIGKGQGRRHLVSQRRHGGEPLILKRFDREVSALRFEREMIAKWRPQANKTGGGEGRSRKRRPSEKAIAARWMWDAVDRAKRTGSPLDILLAIGYVRCELNAIRAAASV